MGKVFLHVQWGALHLVGHTGVLPNLPELSIRQYNVGGVLELRGTYTMIFQDKILLCCLTVAFLIVVSPMALAIDYTLDENGNKTSRISDESAPILDESSVPPRPLRLELGLPFLGTGTITPGYELPGGQILQPSLLIFGTFRTAIQTFKNPLGPSGDQALSEWANRLDIFANFQLTGTERILLGMQPLHDRDLPPTYSGYNFSPERDVRGNEGFVDSLNADITTFFFEGDLGEMFPNLDRSDFGSLDIGISVGRQPLFYQEGLLINDTVDAIGLIRNNLIIPGGSNLQISGLYGWGEINRADNVEQDKDLHLLGLFLQADLPISTVNADFVYTLDEVNDNDGVHWGLSAIQRIGHINTAFHILGSHAVGTQLSRRQSRPVSAVDDGYLLWSEASYVMPWSEDNVYFNTFWGIDSFSSAARGPDVGGPLGRHGLLFASQGLGRYTPALSNQVQEAYGFALGYQMFFDGVRRQLVFELGSTDSTNNDGPTAVAILTRFQQAIGQRTVFQLDAFYSYTDSNIQGIGNDGYGLRSEIRVNF
jgi:hypothetical protein